MSMVTPVRSETYENLQLNAGCFIKNFDYESIADADELRTALADEIMSGMNILGATRGGGTFVVTREIRKPDVDGVRYDFKGGKFVDSADARLNTTIIEVTPENIKDALGSATITTTGKKTVIRMNTVIAPNDYLDNLVWVGDLADGRLVAIVLYNALNTADFSLTFADKNEGTLPVEFHAHQETVSAFDVAPFEIIYFEPNGESESIEITSAAGTNVGETALSTDNVLSSGQHYVYKVGTSSSAPSIGYREEPDYTWNEWSGSGAINVGASANGKKMTVAVVNSSKKVIKSGSVTLVVKTA